MRWYESVLPWHWNLFCPGYKTGECCLRVFDVGQVKKKDWWISFSYSLPNMESRENREVGWKPILTDGFSHLQEFWSAGWKGLLWIRHCSSHPLCWWSKDYSSHSCCLAFSCLLVTHTVFFIHLSHSSFHHPLWPHHYFITCFCSIAFSSPSSLTVLLISLLSFIPSSSLAPSLSFNCFSRPFFCSLNFLFILLLVFLFCYCSLCYSFTTAAPLAAYNRYAGIRIQGLWWMDYPPSVNVQAAQAIHLAKQITNPHNV